ncbi:acyl carrier protein [Streptomyces sp. NPDC047315]|uniref:acyl carrier protein n=1 Tax=Streptomyces sp. NPDC047315 TaxID=3155142 RepID=UPI0033C3762D
MNTDRTEALDLVRDSIVEVVPGADVASLEPDDAFREALEMDSLDFLRFVETLSRRSGIPIEDEDATHLSTLSACTDFLLAHGR